MAKYRFLQSAYVDGRVFNAGEVCDLRDDWVPGPFVEPLCPLFLELGRWSPIKPIKPIIFIFLIKNIKQEQCREVS
jgi:hypothetical protein